MRTNKTNSNETYAGGLPILLLNLIFHILYKKNAENVLKQKNMQKYFCEIFERVFSKNFFEVFSQFIHFNNSGGGGMP